MYYAYFASSEMTLMYFMHFSIRKLNTFRDIKLLELIYIVIFLYLADYILTLFVICYVLVFM